MFDGMKRLDSGKRVAQPGRFDTDPQKENEMAHLTHRILALLLGAASFLADRIADGMSSVGSAHRKLRKRNHTGVPFGIGSCHINNRSIQDFARWMPEMAEIGIRVHRTPQTNWGALEPEQGKWAWKNLDEQMNYLDDRTIRFDILLAGNPGMESPRQTRPSAS